MERYAFKHFEDGRVWLRVVDGDNVYDEPMSEWQYVIDLPRGRAFYRYRNNPLVTIPEA